MNLKVFTIIFITALTHSESFTQACSCGRENIDSRIIGGSRVSENRYPWMVSLTIQRTDGMVTSCGGSLINDLYILTAAHCLNNAKTITALIGTNSRISGGQRHPIVQAKVTNYDDNTMQNDIALLKLAKRVQFTREINPICLPTEDMLDFDTLTVAGWGWTVPGGEPSNDLLEVDVTQYPFEKCNKEWGNGLIASQMCAADIGKDSCGGDSGGPLMVRKRGKMSVVGLVSYGSVQCGTTRNAVYTRVTSFLNWIRRETYDARYCY